MSRSRLLIPIAVTIGILLLVVAAFYFVDTAKSLPSFFPGHQAGSTHHHTKHGIAALVLGLGAFVLAWFASGPREPSATEIS
jgi:hypothetical protein